MSDFVMEAILVTNFILSFLFTLSLCLPNSPSLFHRVSHHSFCLHSTLVIRLSVLITEPLILIGVHQIIIQTFRTDEVRGVIQRGVLSNHAAGSVGVNCYSCKS